MYNAHWIHSLPYSKFIELTLNIRSNEERQILLYGPESSRGIFPEFRMTILQASLIFYSRSTSSSPIKSYPLIWATIRCNVVPWMSVCTLGPEA